MDNFPEDYECDGQIDIWEWMKEKEKDMEVIWQQYFEKTTVTKIRDGEFITTVEEVNAIEIPKNATNGEVIKALFPHFDYEDKTEYFGRIRNLDDHFIKADIDFWNAPYNKG